MGKGTAIEVDVVRRSQNENCVNLGWVDVLEGIGGRGTAVAVTGMSEKEVRPITMRNLTAIFNFNH